MMVHRMFDVLCSFVMDPCTQDIAVLLAEARPYDEAVVEDINRVGAKEEVESEEEVLVTDLARFISGWIHINTRACSCEYCVF